MKKPLFKAKKKKTSAAATLPKVTSTTTLSELATGNIRVSHSQSIRQSINYQTAEANYGLETEVEPQNAERAVRLMETIVQKLLIPKSQSQAGYLSRLTNGH